MELQRKINTISLLLILLAIVMFYLGYAYINWIPVVTGLSLVVVAWGFQMLKKLAPKKH